MVNEKNRESSEFVAGALDKAVRDIYAEHPHECNMVLYIGGAILLLTGAWFEYGKIGA